jgi:protein-disulfide isomerase
LGAIAALLIAVFVFASKWYDRDQTTTTSAAPPAAPLTRPYSPTLGPENAPVTLVEFFDPECESCRAMYPIVKQVMEEFEGQVRLVIRYQPLHQNSVYAASLLEAARAQGKYWEYLEVVMLRQPEWASHAAPRPDLLLTYAPMVGLDADQLRAAATNPEIRTRIEQDARDGQAVGADRTPTFFINGQMLAQLGYTQLRDAIQAQVR